MLKFLTLFTLPLFTLSCSSLVQVNDLSQDLNQLSLVRENYLVMEKDNKEYTFNTYIKLFQRPYYIHIVENNGNAVDESKIMEITKNYILPRGCTTPIENEKILKKNNDNSQMIIKLEC